VPRRGVGLWPNNKRDGGGKELLCQRHGRRRQVGRPARNPAGRDFQDRYKPVGNITLGSDVGLPDEATPSRTQEVYTARQNVRVRSYSFWCCDEAPQGI
jgi:hypothetical protein